MRAARAAITRLTAPLAALAAAGAATAWVALTDPNEPGGYPACPVPALTGVFCPGCGGLRSVHALTRGDAAAALSANTLVVAGCAVLAVVWAGWLVQAVRGRPLALPDPRPVHFWLLGGLVMLFTVLRNLPGGAALAP
ncbi:DUF2752 domain-containing protein [Streptomyces sp. ACA25]|uniref:DUF2752 domain-containing protein n=1 Tax=Streptomyces sp. ACA25 TaxID=3022596 RepID=UPI0023077F1D|nr:DUF2752 domain-containing protein [Streptomyces sp. ACA25]MDB1088621.1 DUF2752 domain-containing protein [Streptomyces sp. ACA25]